jgi:hypothetical protein
MYAGTAATIATVISKPQDASAMQKMEIAVTSLSTFERADQRKEFLNRAQGELKKVISRADASNAMRHVAHNKKLNTACC